jgi:hypothetical protein
MLAMAELASISTAPVETRIGLATTSDRLPEAESTRAPPAMYTT